MPTTPRSLDALLETIRTAVDASLDEAIAEGVTLTGYPYTDRSKPIPLAEELTPERRRFRPPRIRRAARRRRAGGRSQVA